jgi:hypothetical protein
MNNSAFADKFQTKFNYSENVNKVIILSQESATIIHSGHYQQMTSGKNS